METLKKEIANNCIPKLLIFHGEESYLREHYIAQVKKALCPEEFAEFNYTVFDGKVNLYDLSGAVETPPFMNERKMVLVNDYPLFKAAGGEELVKLLSDLPDYICLIFNFDTQEYKPDGRLKITAQITKLAQTVNFERQNSSSLIPWVRKHFSAFGKRIELQELEYFLFLCGNDMQNLKSEIQKTASYTVGDTVKKSDIDAVATPVTEAKVFDFVRAVVDNKPKKAMNLLNDLSASGENGNTIVALVISQIMRLYAARLIIENKKGTGEFSRMFGVTSSYAAKASIENARSRDLVWFRQALLHCYTAANDLRDGGATARERAAELLIAKLFYNKA